VSQPAPPPNAEFFIQVTGTGAVTRRYWIDYDLGLGPGPNTLDVTVSREGGEAAEAPATVSGREIDVTPLFAKIELSALWGMKSAQITIARVGATLATLDLSFEGVGKAEAAAADSHNGFADIKRVSLCRPHYVDLRDGGAVKRRCGAAFSNPCPPGHR
jgi:hypothetical protein